MSRRIDNVILTEHLVRVGQVTVKTPPARVPRKVTSYITEQGVTLTATVSSQYRQKLTYVRSGDRLAVLSNTRPSLSPHTDLDTVWRCTKSLDYNNTRHITKGLVEGKVGRLY